MYTHATEAGWVSRSHQAISPFSLIRPETPQQAVDALSGNGRASFIAGGIDLVRRMRGGDTWDVLVDISAIDGLSGIAEEGACVRIGALATHWEIETSPLLAAKLPDFQAAWTTIGNVRTRMAGTVGGNLLAGEAGYDGRVVLGVLGAQLDLLTADGEISLPADGSSGDLPKDALLTGVSIPLSPGCKMLFDRSLKPVISVAVAVDEGRHRIGVGCAFPAPLFQAGTGAVDAADVSASLPPPVDNPMGGAGYRRRMAGVLAARAYRKLAGGE